MGDTRNWRKLSVFNSEESKVLPHTLSNGAQTFPGSVLQGKTSMENKESASFTVTKQDIKQDFGQMTQETGINKSSRHLNKFLIKIQTEKEKQEKLRHKRKRKLILQVSCYVREEQDIHHFKTSKIISSAALCEYHRQTELI